MDGSPEILESGGAHFYSRILQVNSGEGQRGYSEEAHQGALFVFALRETEEGNPPLDRSPLVLPLELRESGANLGSLLIALVIAFTVVGSVALGITLAYTTVLGLLHVFAQSGTHRAKPALVLVHSQSHAGAD